MYVKSLTGVWTYLQIIIVMTRIFLIFYFNDLNTFIHLYLFAYFIMECWRNFSALYLTWYFCVDAHSSVDVTYRGLNKLEKITLHLSVAAVLCLCLIASHFSSMNIIFNYASSRIV